MSFWCPFLDPPLTIYHSNIGVQIIVALDIGTSTLKITNLIMGPTRHAHIKFLSIGSSK